MGTWRSKGFFLFWGDRLFFWIFFSVGVNVFFCWFFLMLVFFSFNIGRVFGFFSDTGGGVF